MSLLKPTPAELADRISILGLKIQHSSGPVCEAFHKEQKELQDYGREHFLSTNVQMADYFEHLDRIHRQLWIFEDMVRVAPNLETYTAITRLNDERAEVCRAINSLYGVQQIEKLYASK